MSLLVDYGIQAGSVTVGVATIAKDSTQSEDTGITLTIADSDTILDSTVGGTIYNDMASETYATIILRFVTESK